MSSPQTRPCTTQQAYPLKSRTGSVRFLSISSQYAWQRHEQRGSEHTRDSELPEVESAFAVELEEKMLLPRESAVNILARARPSCSSSGYVSPKVVVILNNTGRHIHRHICGSYYYTTQPRELLAPGTGCRPPRRYIVTAALVVGSAWCACAHSEALCLSYWLTAELCQTQLPSIATKLAALQQWATTR